MSEHNPHHGHDQHGHGREQVESSALAPKPILLFLVILFVATAFVFIIVMGLDWGFKQLDESNQGQSATQVESAGRKLPPAPLLQGAPGKDDKPTKLPLEDMEILRSETNKAISSYGWVDKTGGVAHVPIDRAKAMIAETGLPAMPSTTISDQLQKAETVRKEVLEAGSNAGRMIKATGQSQQSIQQPNQGQPAQPQIQRPPQNQGQPAQPQAQKPQQNPGQPAQPQDQKPQQKVPPQQH